MSIEIAPSHLEMIVRHGEQSYPHECCGFLLGVQEDGRKVVRAAIPTGNARSGEARRTRFLITPREYMRMERRARERGMEIIGFYHSHPDAAARPSEYDREHAWPWYSYLIVSVKHRRAEEVTSWTLSDDRANFTSEELIVRQGEHA